DRYTKNINFQHPLQAINDVYSDDVQQLVKAAIELGVQIDLQPTQVVLYVGDHQESYHAQATFDFSKGARDVILSDFPEVQDFQEK
ncbi:MAG: glutamate--cysteine ligase, partial [Limosilactobacillus sp.]|nr:glutamate--cysteine ligase [Limosilactobacillus sp.]